MKSTLPVFFLALFCSPLMLKAQCPVVDLGPDTVICVGTSITLNAENNGASYSWSDGSTGASMQTFFEGEYFVHVTRDGCTVSDTIYVQHGAVIYADFSYVQSTSCSPFTTTFTEYSQACNGSVVEWTWDFGDGNTSTSRNPVHDYAATGNYTVTLIVKKNSGAVYSTQQVVAITGNMTPAVNLGNDISLCEGTNAVISAGNPGASFLWNTGETTSAITVFDAGEYSVAVTKDGCTAHDTVTANSVPELWSDFTSAKVSDCLPVTYQFEDKSTACESTITDWFWEFGDGSTSTDQNPQHPFQNDGQYIVKLTVFDNFGNSIRRSKKITVTSTTVSVDLGNDTTICFGSSLTLDAGNPGYTYLWSNGQTTPQITVWDDGNYSVTIQKNGCVAKDTISVTTSASVTTRWNFSKSGDCLPVTVSFTDSSEVYCGQTISSWHWDFGDGTTSSEQHPVHIYQTADSFLVRLTVTSSNGSVSGRSQIIGITNTPPVPDLPQEVTVCANQTFTLDAGVEGAEYAWTPVSQVSDATIQDPVIKPSSSTWISVTVRKCQTDVTDSIYVIVDSLNKPGVIQQGNMLQAGPAAAYEWYRDGQKIANASQSTLRMDRQGYYSVKIFNASGCSRQSDPLFFMPRSRTEKDDDVVVRCSPNPSHGAFNILLSRTPEKGAEVRIHDLYGKVLFHLQLRDHVTPLNMHGKAKGLYFAEISIDNKKRILPIILQ